MSVEGYFSIPYKTLSQLTAASKPAEGQSEVNV